MLCLIGISIREGDNSCRRANVGERVENVRQRRRDNVGGLYE